jgi:hypothetical protein
MKITEIYKRYDIMPILQLHQLRVAAVAKQVCESLEVKVDSNTVITACLLHDMGNIIKFDLSLFPQYLEPEGFEYWDKVRNQFIDTYGTDEHKASIAIAKELGMKQPVLDCIEAIDFGKAVENVERKELEPKICDNADMRVGPHGILSVDERLEEGAKRYKNRIDKWVPPEKQKVLHQAVRDIQEQVFAHSRIKPSSITDVTIAPIIEELRSYEI